jgi:ketosteroid isomerase-like protein
MSRGPRRELVISAPGAAGSSSPEWSSARHIDNGTGTVVALTTITATRNGEEGSFASAQVWSLAGGKITSYKEHYGDEAAMNAFWS